MTPYPINAQFTEETIRVYQAYSPAIAVPAVKEQRFVAPFKRERMTWIKPSFLWMMYRSGWATKPDQERVLAIDIQRSGFEWALRHACLSHFVPQFYRSNESWEATRERRPVRIQFDPDRGPRLEKLERRAIQIGLSGNAAARYVDHWIVAITDITEQVHALHRQGQVEVGEAYLAALPKERRYPVDFIPRDFDAEPRTSPATRFGKP